MKKTYKELKNDDRYLNINVNGNKKLVNNENTKFIIWNLPAKTTCPYATEHCKKACYACKAERVYPGCKAAREKNLERSKKDSFVNDMIYTIETEINTKKFENKKIIFRIHESGDFYNLEYTQKWVEIAKHFENNKNIIFVAYTKSIIYFINCGYGLEMFPENLQIISSIWDDTSPENWILTRAYNFPIYTALSGDDMETEKKNGRIFTECRCNDCASCGKCWDKKEREIIVKIH